MADTGTKDIPEKASNFNNGFAICDLRFSE